MFFLLLSIPFRCHWIGKGLHKHSSKFLLLFFTEVSHTCLEPHGYFHYPVDFPSLSKSQLTYFPHSEKIFYTQIWKRHGKDWGKENNNRERKTDEGCQRKGNLVTMDEQRGEVNLDNCKSGAGMKAGGVCMSSIDWMTSDTDDIMRPEGEKHQYTSTHTHIIYVAHKHRVSESESHLTDSGWAHLSKHIERTKSLWESCPHSVHRGSIGL